MSYRSLVCAVLALPLPSNDPVDFTPAFEMLSRAIKEQAFPGCAAAVGTHLQILHQGALGSVDYEGGGPVTAQSLFDLASLTKVIGTTSVVLVLERDGKLSLTDPVSRYIPTFHGGEKDKVTIEHLLTHSSGLPAWKPLYREAQGYGAVIEKAISVPLEDAPGTRERYSDIGFMILGEVAARAAGRPLPAIERELVFDPLGLSNLRRDPPESEMERIVPTEKVPTGPLRGPGEGLLLRGIRGKVHDENAAAAGGLTGHAGLFATIDDLSRLARELLKGYRGESPVFPAELVRKYVTRRDLVKGSSRALGWDTPSEGSSAGKLLGPRSFGHTGFTGTSLWVDPDRDLFLILLTNRVHPTRENLAILAVRRQFADLVVRCFDRTIERP